MEDHCLMCGEIIPEGRQVCPVCEGKYNGTDDSNSQAVFLSQKIGKPDPRHKEGSG